MYQVQGDINLALWGEPGMGKSWAIENTDGYKGDIYRFQPSYTYQDDYGPFFLPEASSEGVRRVNEARKAKDRKRNRLARVARRRAR